MNEFPFAFVTGVLVLQDLQADTVKAHISHALLHHA